MRSSSDDATEVARFEVSHRYPTERKPELLISIGVLESNSGRRFFRLQSEVPGGGTQFVNFRRDEIDALIDALIRARQELK